MYISKTSKFDTDATEALPVQDVTGVCQQFGTFIKFALPIPAPANHQEPKDAFKMMMTTTQLTYPEKFAHSEGT